MKRDMDLVREILIAIEDAPPGRTIKNDALDHLHADGTVITEHVRMLTSAGLIEGDVIEVMSDEPTEFMIDRLTWDGHEFLAAVRSADVWARTKAKILEHGGGFTFEILKAVASNYLKQTLGLPPG